MDQYGHDNKILNYFRAERKDILVKLSKKNFSVEIVEALSEFYLTCRKGLYKKKQSNKFANLQIDNLLKKIIDSKCNNVDDNLKIIESHIRTLQSKRREERYQTAESDTYRNAKQECSMSDDEKRIIKQKVSALNKTIERGHKGLFKNIDGYQFVRAGISKDRVDEIISKLAKLTIELRNGYDIPINWHDTKHCWDSYDYKYWEESTIFKTGYIYIATNKFMPGLVKIGKTSLTIGERGDKLAGHESVPFNFQFEYYRKTVLDYPLDNGRQIRQIEKRIQNAFYKKLIADGYFEYENEDLQGKEFFMVPSVKFAIMFVDDYLDRLDRILFLSEWYDKI